jgi:hypothetical protein
MNYLEVIICGAKLNGLLVKTKLELKDFIK